MVAKVERVTLATPVLGGMDPRVTLSFMRTVAEFERRGIKWTWQVLMQNAIISHARNTIVREFLASDHERLVFIDADMTFDPEDVFALLDREEDFVGALVSTKGAARKHNAAIMKEGIVKEKDVYGQGALYEAAFVGTGFLTLSRKCLENLVKAHPETAYRDAPDAPVSHALFETGVMQGQFVGEDLFLCLRWRKLGGRCWLHTGLNIGHVGTHVYPSKDLVP